MNGQFKVRVFSIITILGMLFGAVGIPTQNTLAAPAGTALQFNGSNQYVSFYQAAPVNTGPGVKAFTIETWFNYTGGIATSTGAGGLTAAIPLVTKGRGEADGDNRDMNYFLGISGGKLAADFEECKLDSVTCPNADPNGTYNGGMNYPVYGTRTISTGVWHHTAVTLDGTNFCLYLDGTLDSCRVLPGSTPRWPRWDSIQRAALGSALNSSGGAAGYLAGVLDEVRIWDVALPQSMIQANMYQEITSGTNLVARWGLNEGSPAATINSSVGTFPGTLTNSPTWVSGFPLPDTTPPATPTGLTATGGNKSVNLTWTENSETDLAGYNLYRNTTTGGPYTKVNTLLITGTSYSDTNLTNGASYYYVLRAVDSSANESGNSSEATAMPIEINTALQFTTASGTYVTFGDPDKLDIAAFTIETWFKRTGTGTTSTTGSGGITNAIPLVTHGSPEADGSNVDADWVLVINDTTKTIGADFEDMATGLNHPVSGTTPIVNDVWYHAAATYDGTTWKLYLNGNLETTLVVGAFTPRSDSTQRAALGTMLASTGTPNGYFQGVIDEARVWNVARSQSQIRADINSQLTTGAGLVARWGLNDGTGTVVEDSIPAVANGIITGLNFSWVAGTPFNISFDTTPPATPTGLFATPGDDSASLTWNANSEPDLAGYNVYRSTTSPVIKTTPINGSLLSSPAYTDSAAIHGSTYYYAVTAVDTSDNESGLSTEASATPTVPPAPAYGLQFDGSNDYVTFGTAAGLGTQNFTIETWFKRTGAGASISTGSNGVTLIPLVAKGAPQADGTDVDENYILGIRASDNVLAGDFEIYAACNGRAAGDNNPIIGVTPIANNTWYHAAFTYDGTALKLYLNGNLEATLPSTCIPRYDNTQPAALGTTLTTTPAAQGFFNGVMDEVRIWNYARDISELRSTANAQLTNGTGLLARWGMGEGSGTTINSSVGTFPGTLTNGPAWVTPGAPFNIVFDTVPPAAPTNLMSSPRPGAVLLEWTTNTETDLAGYRVYRSTGTPVVKGTPITGTLTSPSFIDTTVSSGTTYYYAVTAMDSSGNESDLSNETSVIPLPSPPAEALDLGNSNAYVNLGDFADTAQFTLETWLRRDGNGAAISTGTGGETLVPVITNGTAEAENAGADINYFFGIRGSDGVLCADFEEAQSGSSPSLNHPVCGVTSLQNGIWYHAAVTYNGTNWMLYLNGNLEKTLGVGQPANAENTSHLAFGTSLTTTDATTGFFDGALDEVRIWNYARTQAQVASTINTKLPDPQTGLIGRWGLDEASGSMVNDSSGSTITGTISGSGFSWIQGSPFNAVINLAPDMPVLVTPANGAANVPTNTTLTVNVSDPESQPLNVTFYGRLKQAAAGPDFTFIVIPDAQYYASTYPAIYNAQMNWVKENKTSTNITFVASLGDNVDTASNLTQWTNADAAYDILDTAGVAYGLEAGNHDGAPSGTGNFNTYFGVSRFEGKSWYGGHYGSDNDNHYALFSASGLDFIVIFIEYDDTMTSTSHPVLVWANNLLQTHSARRAIIVSHNMLSGNNFSTQGQTVYNALKANPNLFLMLGGHLDVAGQRSDTYNGRTVYTLRSDYQSVDSQQSGYLRIMRFSPADDMIYIRTYSPTQNKDYDKSDAGQNNFTLSYAMEGLGYSVIGTATNVASGNTASVSWTDLDPTSQYEWFVISSDGTHQTSSDTWNFSTLGVNTAPIADDQSKTTDEDTAKSITLTASDANNDPLTYSVLAGPSHGSLSGIAPNLTYSPVANYNGADSFTFKASDGSVDSNTATVTITILPVNDAPIALADGYSTPQNSALTIPVPGVLTNDTDADNDPLTAVKVSDPGNGALSLNSDGSFTFTPNSCFTGDDTFIYKANDGTADGNTTTVTIHVSLVNQAPSARAGGPYTADLGSGLALDGSASTDPNAGCGDSIVSYEWLVAGTIGLTGATPSLTSAQISELGVGSHQVRLTVRDEFGVTGIAVTTLSIYDNSPVASFTAVPNPATCGQSIFFDASGSSHGRPDRLIVNYNWDFGDGQSTTGATASYAYSHWGVYTASLTVTDNNVPAKTDIATLDVTITLLNQAPHANAGGPYSVDLGNGVTLNGTGSYDPNASCGDGIVSWEWDVNGDGNYSDLTGSMPTMSGSQVNALGVGSHTIRLRVTDMSGLTHIGTATLDIYDNRPFASFTTVPNPAACSQSINFDASGSSHGRPDRLIVNYSWDFGDGQNGSGQTTTHSYSAFGAYTVSLTVTDNNIPARTDSTTVLVSVSQGNQPPTANAGGPYTVTVDNGITLNGTGSYDPNAGCGDSVVSYAWLVAGTINLTGPMPSLTPAQIDTLGAGSHSVTLTVTDKFGAAGSATTALTINQACYPLTLGHAGNGTDPVANPVKSAACLVNGEYIEGELIQLGEATPDLGWHISGWTGTNNNSSAANTNVVTMPASAHSASVDYLQNEYTLTINQVGEGTIGTDISGPYHHGDIVILTATPAVHWNFSAWSGDLTGSANPASITMDGNKSVTGTFTFINTPPIANDQTLVTDEDAPLPILLTGSDAEGDALIYTVVSSPAHGALSGTAANLTYTPALHYNGFDSFTFQVNDGSADSNIATVAITVNPVNTPPACADTAITTDEDTAGTVAPSCADVDNTTLTYAIASQPSDGAAIVENGLLKYTPPANFNGNDSFTYTGNDGTATSEPARVLVTVNAINDAPIANGQSLTTDEDTPLNITLIGSDVENDSLTFTIISTPAHGTLSGNAPNLTYLPEANWNGSESFTFKVNDGSVDSSSATVEITVSPVNDSPVANDDSYATDENVLLNVATPGILSNDTDVDGDNLTASVVTSPTHGDLILNADGSFTYTPNTDYSGLDSFGYSASDGNGGTAAANVVITVNPVNHPPVAENQDKATDEDVPVSITLAATDADNDKLTFAVIANPLHGALTGTAPNLTFTPYANYSGTDSFTYRANDGQADSNVAVVSITVNPVNDAPVVSGQDITTSEDTVANVTLGGSDVDGDPLTYQIVTPPAHGTLTGAAPNLAYMPEANYFGQDNFTFKASDGKVDSNTAAVHITVTAVNDPPVANDQSVSTAEDTAKGITLTGSDVENNPLTIAVLTNPSHGSLAGTTPNLTYTPVPNFNGLDVFTFSVNDGTANSNIATISISVAAVNDSPVAVNDTATTLQDTSVTIPVLANDSDVDDDSLAVTAVSTPAHGNAGINVNNTVTYTPVAGWSGSDSFTYTISDGHGGTATAVVNVTITQDNTLIFKDSFGSCNAAAWSSTVNGSALTFSSTAAWDQPCGMSVNTTSHNPAYMRDDKPNAETRYLASFYFNTNGIRMGKNNSHAVFTAYDSSGMAMVVIELRKTGSSFQMRAGTFNDRNKWSYTSWVTLPTGWQAITLDWRAATSAGANNGGLSFTAGSNPGASISALDNDTRRVDWIALGAVQGLDAGTSGTYYFDAFESRR